MATLSAQTAADDPPSLSLALDKACYFIVKARAFHVKDVSTTSDPGSNAVDDGMRGVLEDRPDDPVEEELRAFIAGMSEDEQIELVALLWLGRDGLDAAEWPSIRTEAARAHADHPRQTVDYLLGEPLVGDHVEEGLSILGLTCADQDAADPLTRR